MGKDIWEAHLPDKRGIDLRGTPTHKCVCGNGLFVMIGSFEDSELAFYFLDAECLNCGNLVTLPTPVDSDEDSLI